MSMSSYGNGNQIIDDYSENPSDLIGGNDRGFMDSAMSNLPQDEVRRIQFKTS